MNGNPIVRWTCRRHCRFLPSFCRHYPHLHYPLCSTIITILTVLAVLTVLTVLTALAALSAIALTSPPQSLYSLISLYSPYSVSSHCPLFLSSHCPHARVAQALLHTGVLLCEVVNKISPGAVKKVRNTAIGFHHMYNIHAFLEVAPCHT